MKHWADLPQHSRGCKRPQRLKQRLHHELHCAFSIKKKKKKRFFFSSMSPHSEGHWRKLRIQDIISFMINVFNNELKWLFYHLFLFLKKTEVAATTRSCKSRKSLPYGSGGEGERRSTSLFWEMPCVSHLCSRNRDDGIKTYCFVMVLSSPLPFVWFCFSPSLPFGRCCFPPSFFRVVLFSPLAWCFLLLSLFGGFGFCFEAWN